MIGLIHRDYTTGYSVFAVDTVAELTDLPTTSKGGVGELKNTYCKIGSRAIVTATSDRYILNGSDEWVIDKNAGGGGSDIVFATNEEINSLTEDFLA